MTTSKIKPLTLTNAIAINMARSIAILIDILFFIIISFLLMLIFYMYHIVVHYNN